MQIVHFVKKVRAIANAGGRPKGGAVSAIIWPLFYENFGNYILDTQRLIRYFHHTGYRERSISITQTKDVANNQPNAFTFFERFPDEDSAREYLINSRWPNGVICPHCGHDQVYRIRNGKLFRCKDKECAKQFTVRIATLMEDSALPFRKWLYAMYLFGINPKGIASTRMAELIGITQKTAWHLDHRLREAFVDDGIVLDGIAEIDETYIGGNEKNQHKSRHLNSGRGPIGKTAVLGVNQRDGDIVAHPVEKTDAETVSGAVNKCVVKTSAVYTDDAGAYNGVKTKRESVNHSAGEYVRDDVFTNRIESTRALLKRAHYGNYHCWNEKYQYRYVNGNLKRSVFHKIPAFDKGDGSGITIIRLMMASLSGQTLIHSALTNG